MANFKNANKNGTAMDLFIYSNRVLKLKCEFIVCSFSVWIDKVYKAIPAGWYQTTMEKRGTSEQMNMAHR